MADEQTPPKRDVNELFTLDASNPTSDHDGPLAYLLSTSPVSELHRSSSDPDASSAGDDELPGISDVSGLEDLHVTTAEVPLGDTAGQLSPPVDPGWAEGVDSRPVGSELAPAGPRPVEPAPVPLDRPADSDPIRSIVVGGNLRFSTEAEPRSATNWTLAPNDHHPYPARLVPNAVPAPVAPSRSVRVPGQERRRGALYTALVEITERRWFWPSVAGCFGLVLLTVLVVGNVVPNPLADDRIDVVAENRVPTAPAVGGATETSDADTSSSTGAGTGPFEPAPTTSLESTSSSTVNTSTRRVVTTARPTVRSTTGPAPSTSPTAAPTSTSVPSTITTATSTTAVSSSTTDPGSSTTTDPGSSTTTTGESTTTDTTDTTDDSTTTTGSNTTASTTTSTGP